MVALWTLLDKVIAQHGQIVGIISSRNHSEELEFAGMACVVAPGGVDGQDFGCEIVVTRSVMAV